MIATILLTAGSSRRFGSPKALAQLNDKTVIEHLQTMLLKTQVDEIIVVLGAHSEEIKPYLLNHTKVKFVYNKDHIFGQTSSFQAGLTSLSDHVRGVFLLPIDYPLVKESTMDKLIRYFGDDTPLILVPAFKGQKGHPPLFSTALKEEFLRLDHATGLNTIAHAHQEETVVLSVEDAGVVKTFNTQREFDALRQQLI